MHGVACLSLNMLINVCNNMADHALQPTLLPALNKILSSQIGSKREASCTKTWFRNGKDCDGYNKDIVYCAIHARIVAALHSPPSSVSHAVFHLWQATTKSTVARSPSTAHPDLHLERNAQITLGGEKRQVVLLHLWFLQWHVWHQRPGGMVKCLSRHIYNINWRCFHDGVAAIPQWRWNPARSTQCMCQV